MARKAFSAASRPWDKYTLASHPRVQGLGVRGPVGPTSGAFFLRRPDGFGADCFGARLLFTGRDCIHNSCATQQSRRGESIRNKNEDIQENVEVT